MHISPKDIKYRVLNTQGKVISKGHDSRRAAEDKANPVEHIQGYVSDHRRVGARILADRRALGDMG